MDHYPWLQNQQDPEQGKEVRMLGTQQMSGPLVVRGANAGPMDLGSQVAARRNLEFTAGQRSHRISTGSYTKA